MTSFAFRKLPEGVKLEGTSRAVFDVLAQFTSFPWPVMQAQCRREDVDPTAITRLDLERLIPHFALAVARFTSPEKGDQVAQALRLLSSAA